MIACTPANIDEFLACCGRCGEIQEQVLLDILRQAAGSAVGKKLGFSEIKNYRDFKNTVPPQKWSDLEPYAVAMEKGAADQLFNGTPDYFVCTSGTTGAVKKMPESPRGRFAKSLATRLRVEAMTRHAPDTAGGDILPLVNNAIEGYTECGLPFGSASGIALATAPQSLIDRTAFPLEVLEAGYGDALEYLLLRFSIPRDVRVVFGNNAGRIEQFLRHAEQEADRLIADIAEGTITCDYPLDEGLLETLRQKCAPNPKLAETLRRRRAETGRFLPETYWPSLRVITCWLAGSVGRYAKGLRPLLAPGVRLFDLGYGATEGKFNIPLEPENPAGPLAVFSGFYEFRRPGEDNFLRAHELEDGESYELYITNYSGLYRYALKDVVRVDGFEGDTPRILFEYKAGEMLNLAGEKVAAATLLSVIPEALGEEPVHWCAVEDAEHKRYLFCIELSEAPEDPHRAAAVCAEKIENALMEKTLIYPVFRNQKLLREAGVVLMKPGWTEALYAEQTRKGRSKVQIKLPLVSSSIPHPDMRFAQSP